MGEDRLQNNVKPNTKIHVEREREEKLTFAELLQILVTKCFKTSFKFIRIYSVNSVHLQCSQKAQVI